jgi:hypothetical protein
LLFFQERELLLFPFSSKIPNCSPIMHVISIHRI